MNRLLDLALLVILVGVGFVFYGLFGAFAGAVIAILGAILGEVRRMNDSREPARGGSAEDRFFSWLDRKTGGRISGDGGNDGTN